MSFNDFNGKGEPLEDKRLTLSGTTPAGKQQYRIWRDSQQILVPKGQSVSKPNAPENVQANTGVFGSIKQGYFQRPTVEFRNTQDYKLFDRFFLCIKRDELPTDPDIDWGDLVTTVYIQFHATFTIPVLDITGQYGGVIPLRYNGKEEDKKGIWVSDVMHFDEYNLKHVQGDFIIVTNPTAHMLTTGQTFSTAQFLQPVNLPIDIIVNDVVIHNGNSEMKVSLKNPLFAPTLKEFSFEILGGEQ